MRSKYSTSRFGWHGPTSTSLFFIFLLIISIPACNNQTSMPVLAKFDGDVVLQNEYIDHYLLSTQYKPNQLPSEDNLEKIVSLKAMEKMELLEARAKNIDKDSLYSDIVEKNENKLLFYHYMRHEIIDQVITDSLINKFYLEFTPQYQMRYIMRPVVSASTKEFEKSQKDTIDYVYKSLQSGQTFEDLAKKFSQDITTKEKGGDLGFVIRESLGDAKLRAVMDTLSQYAYSKPFRGFEGYYILYKGKKRDVPVPEFSKVRDQIWKTLFRTRRHLIKIQAERRFTAWAPKYNFKIHEDVINEMKTKAGGNTQTSEFDLLNFRALSVEDMNKVLAEYNKGVIRVFDLFKNRKKAPETMNEFYEVLKQLSQQTVLAQHARELGMQNIEEVQQKVTAMKDDVMRSILFEKMVKEKTRATLDSLTQANPSEKPNRMQIEQKFKDAFEENIKGKYNFRFVPENFEKALKAAQKMKEEQNQQKNK